MKSLWHSFYIVILLYACSTSPSNSRPDQVLFEREGLVALLSTDSGNIIFDYLLERQIEIPKQGFQKLVLSSSTQLAYFEAIDELDKVIGAPWLSAIGDSVLQSTVNSKRIAEIVNGAQIDVERILKLQPDLFLYTRAERELAERLLEQGVAVFPFEEYRDQKPMERVEWLIPVGIILEEEEKGKTRYLAIQEAYNRAKLFDGKKQGEILLASFYNGKWSFSGENSVLAQICRDAGYRYYLSNREEPSFTMDVEKALYAIGQVDVLGLIHYGPLTREALQEMDARVFDVLESQGTELFYIDTESSAYFERGTLEPHVLLSEFIKRTGAELEGCRYLRPL